MVSIYRKKFWVSLILTAPILGLSPQIQKILGLSETLRFPGDIFVLFALATGIFVCGGSPFLKGSFDDLKMKNPGMMTLSE